jgi:hypothetical protein
VNRPRLGVCTILILFGLLGLLNNFNKPRLSGVHVSDRIQLVASGFILGMAFGVLLGGRKFEGEE